MISIQPLWLSKNDTDIIYKKKYYKISKKIKKHLKIQYVKDNNYTVKCYNTMKMKYKNYMIIDDKTNNNYEKSNLVSDGLHFGRVGYCKWIEYFINNIVFGVIDWNKKILFISDSSIDYAPYHIPLEQQNKIINDRHNILTNKLVSIGFNKNNIIIDAIGGTGYISSGTNDYQKTINILNKIQEKEWYSISYFCDGFDIRDKINIDKLDKCIKILKKYIFYDNNLFLFRLMKYNIIYHKQIDYVIALGFGNDIINIKELNEENSLEYKMLRVMFNLFWSYTKVNLIP